MAISLDLRRIIKSFPVHFHHLLLHCNSCVGHGVVLEEQHIEEGTVTFFASTLKLSLIQGTVVLVALIAWRPYNKSTSTTLSQSQKPVIITFPADIRVLDFAEFYSLFFLRVSSQLTLLYKKLSLLQYEFEAIEKWELLQLFDRHSSTLESNGLRFFWSPITLLWFIEHFRSWHQFFLNLKHELATCSRSCLTSVHQTFTQTILSSTVTRTLMSWTCCLIMLWQ